MVYHGRFNGMKFNTVERADDITVRETGAEEVGAAKITPIIPVGFAFAAGETALQRLMRIQETVYPGWSSENLMKAGIKQPLIIYGFGESSSGGISGSAKIIPTAPVSTLKRRRGGFNHGVFNGTDFDRLRPFELIRHAANAWAYMNSSAGWMQSEISAGEDISGQLCADIPIPLVIYCFSDSQSDAVSASQPELLPSVPLLPTAAAETFSQTAKASIVVGGGANDIERIYNILHSTGFRVAYNHRISVPDAPYIVYLRDSSPNMFADDRTYVRINRWLVVLCTEKKNREAEIALEKVLDIFDIPYEVTDEQYVKDEGYYQIVYEFESIEG